MTMAAESSTVQVNGMTMRYQVSGAGEPLILLHGGTATLESWGMHLPAFVQHFTVYALDSRAHGQSDNPSGTLSYAQMADDVAAFITAMGLERPMVMGYSDGGQIAMALGMNHPTLARALVISGAFYKMTPKYFEGMHEIGFPSPGEVDFERFERENGEWIEYLKKDHVREGELDYWKTLMRQISLLWSTPIAYTAAEVARIEVPALVAVGDRDESADMEQEVELYRMLPKGELLVFPNANHMHAYHQLSNPLVVDFLVRQVEPKLGG